MGHYVTFLLFVVTIGNPTYGELPGHAQDGIANPTYEQLQDSLLQESSDMADPIYEEIPGAKP